jgi:hypothetical protein
MKLNRARHLLVTILVAILPLSVQAQSQKKGGSNGGGGNGSCGTLIEDNYRELRELDGYAQYLDVQNTVLKVSPRFGARLVKASLLLEWIMTCTDLPYVGEDIGFLVGSEQVARQVDGAVYIDQRKTSDPRFTERAKAMLIMHETLQYILFKRNDEFKLGLTSAEIHERVRRVTFQLFAFHNRFKNGPSFSEYDIKQLLAKNDFGGWIMGEQRKAIVDSLPATVQSIAQHIDRACSAQTRTISGAELEALTSDVSKNCRNCGMMEMYELLNIFKTNRGFSVKRKVTFVEQSGLVTQNPVQLTDVSAGDAACEKAKIWAVSPPAVADKIFQPIICEGWDPVRNSCDTEEISLLNKIDGAYLRFYRK